MVKNFQPCVFSGGSEGNIKKTTSLPFISTVGRREDRSKEDASTSVFPGVLHPCDDVT
jgi:hypothetical protein